MRTTAMNVPLVLAAALFTQIAHTHRGRAKGGRGAETP